MESLCKCGGGGSPRQEHFQHIPQRAIWELQLGSEETFFMEAMIRYGTEEHQLDGMT